MASIENQIFDIFNSYIKSNNNFVISTACSALGGKLTLEAFIVGEIPEHKTVDINNYLTQKTNEN